MFLDCHSGLAGPFLLHVFWLLVWRARLGGLFTSFVFSNLFASFFGRRFFLLFVPPFQVDECALVGLADFSVEVNIIRFSG